LFADNGKSCWAKAEAEKKKVNKKTE